MMKLRLFKVRPKGLMKMMLFSLLAVCIVACSLDDDLKPFEKQDPDRLFISGEREVAPDATETYTIGGSDMSGTWSVTGPATLSSNSGNSVVVTFTGSGDVQISVSGNGLTGIADVSAANIDATFDVVYTLSGIVGDGGSDIVTFKFQKPLTALPTIRQNGTLAADTSIFDVVDGFGQTPFTSGGAGEVLTALSEVSGSNMTEFQATYSAGTGAAAGQIEVLLQGIEVSSNFGGAKVDSMYVLLHSIDLVAPIEDGTSGVSTSAANDGTEVTFTFAFNEAMRPATSSVLDTLELIVNYSGGAQGEDVAEQLIPTEDPNVFTLTHMISGGGDGFASVTLPSGTLVDLAGNGLSVPTGFISLAVAIDNTAPIASGTATDNDPGKQVMHIVTDVQWVVLKDGSPAADDLVDFLDGGTGEAFLVLDKGTYDVYFIDVDAAGNVSDIAVQENVIIE